MTELQKRIVVRDLPEAVQTRLGELQDQKAIRPLSKDKEESLFLMFLCGDDLDAIASKTSLPRDIIYSTAYHYKWTEKSQIMNNYAGVPEQIQKNLVNTLLIATYASMQKELGEVIAGKRTADECAFIPKNIKGLTELVKMVSEVNGIKPAEDNKATTSTIIHATNVQLNQSADKPEPKTLSKEDEAFAEKFQ